MKFRKVRLAHVLLLLCLLAPGGVILLSGLAYWARRKRQPEVLPDGSVKGFTIEPREVGEDIHRGPTWPK